MNKFYNIVKQSMAATSPEDVAHETIMEQEASLKMAQAKKKWILDYQSDREKKNQYVRQHLLAQNLDVGVL